MSDQKTPPPPFLVWMDLEMTGLDPDRDEIIELAVLITDNDLNIIARGPELILHQSPERFQQMDAWNREQHMKSGLWPKVVQSTVTAKEAEEQVLHFLRRHIPEKKVPLCGNSIWQDRRFLVRYMPRVDQFLHYRMVDVSTVKELARRWIPNSFEKLEKQSAHRAVDDILETIAELKFYRENFFKQQAT